jgi:beta-N-acetylhexosaminidase
MAEEKKETTHGMTEAERREARHRNRVRSQVTAYVTLAVIALVIFGCVVWLVTYLGNLKTSRTGAGTEVATTIPDPDVTPEQETETDPEVALEELMGEEEELVAPEPEVVEEEVPTAEELLDELVNAAIEVMPLEDKVAGLFFTTPESITGVSAAVKAGDGTRAALEKYPVGGLVYASRNIQSESQFSEMLNTTLTYVSYPTFLGVIEEGGKVSSVTNSGIGTKQSSASDLAAAGDVNAVTEAGNALGSTLISLGLDVDFAPIADLEVIDNSALKGRTYGSDPAAVSGYVNAMVAALDAQNVTACAKFFPSEAASSENPDTTRATSARTPDELRGAEFQVWKSAIDNGLQMAQISNVIFESLDADNVPCSLSSAVVTDLLRNELGFNGIIISGDLGDATVKDYFGSDEAAIMALKAGCDMIYCPEDFEKAYNGVLEAVNQGVVSETRVDDALRRIYRVKYRDKILQ